MKKTDRKFIVFILFLISFPFNVYVQNVNNQLLSILKGYEQLKYFDFSFTYTSLDRNKDAFYLENKGELLFTNFWSKSYYRIGGLNVDILYTNKFLKKKHFVLKSHTNNTTVYDVEIRNVRIYEEMNNQLNYTRFKINQLVPPVFLRDSSNMYNRRFFYKILTEKSLGSKDTLMTSVDVDSNYQDKYYRFEIYFKNFDENKALKKWGRYFEKRFINNLRNKQFVILIDKQNLLPVEYRILLDDNNFETYNNIKINSKNISSTKNFNPYSYEPFPYVFCGTSMEKGRIRKSQRVMSDRYAFDFTGVNCLNRKKIRFFDEKSEYVLLYVWNSQTAENSNAFQELCKFAEKNPQKLSIIGLNNYNESFEYIEKIYQKYNWQFPSIKGKEICKRYFVSESPTFILTHKVGGKYLLDDSYFILNPKSILSVLSK